MAEGECSEKVKWVSDIFYFRFVETTPRHGFEHAFDLQNILMAPFWEWEYNSVRVSFLGTHSDTHLTWEQVQATGIIDKAAEDSFWSIE